MYFINLKDVACAGKQGIMSTLLVSNFLSGDGCLTCAKIAVDVGLRLIETNFLHLTMLSI